MSDDGTILPESEFQGGILQVNDSTQPVQVFVSFDASGRIGLIRDTAGEIYYISPTEYEKLGQAASYAEMASDESLRRRYVKIEPGESEIRFFQIVDGTAIPGENGHKLSFSPSGIEPHLIRVGAPPGMYEIRLRVENGMGALRTSGHYFEISGSDLVRASGGSPEVEGSGVGGVDAMNGSINFPLPQPSDDLQETRRSIPAPGALFALMALGLAAAIGWRRQSLR